MIKLYTTFKKTFCLSFFDLLVKKTQGSRPQSLYSIIEVAASFALLNMNRNLTVISKEIL